MSRPCCALPPLPSIGPRVTKHHGWRWSRLSLAAILVSLTACRAEAPAGPTAAVQGQASETDFLRASVGGQQISESIMLRVLDRIAHRVAVAMADPAVRAEIYESLHGSPYREGKIHFRSLLLSQGDFQSRPSRLAAAMQRGTLGGLETLRSTLDSLVDLEFYIPVHDHRVSWQGDPNLVVATAMRDHVIPTGYRVGGEPFVFESAEDPPEVPVLAIVPLDESFGDPGRS